MKSNEIETFFKEVFGPEISELLNSEKWNERKDGFVLLNHFIRENCNESSIKNNIDNLMGFLKTMITIHRFVEALHQNLSEFISLRFAPNFKLCFFLRASR